MSLQPSMIMLNLRTLEGMGRDASGRSKGNDWLVMTRGKLTSGTVTRDIPQKHVKCCHVGMHDAEQMQGLQHVIPKYYRGDHGGP